MDEDWDEIENRWQGSTRKSALGVEANLRRMEALWAARKRRMRWAAILGYTAGILIALTLIAGAGFVSVAADMGTGGSVALGLLAGLPSGAAAWWVYGAVRTRLEVRAIMTT